MLDWWKSFLSVFQKEKPREIIGGLPTEFPTKEDVDFARKQGFGYGSGMEGLLESGRHIPGEVPEGLPLNTLMEVIAKRTEGRLSPSKDVADLYLQNALAANRSGIASLGFNPRRISIDKNPERYNIGGLYRDASDILWSRLASPSSLVHESLHRGISTLANEGSETARGLTYGENESAVRRVMRSMMGDPEKPPPGMSLQDYDKSVVEYDPKQSPRAYRRLRELDTMEREAKEILAKRRPRGPR